MSKVCTIGSTRYPKVLATLYLYHLSSSHPIIHFSFSVSDNFEWPTYLPRTRTFLVLSTSLKSYNPLYMIKTFW